MLRTTMDSNSEEMYLQNIEEYVLDEDKIVTYKWLSKALNIHVNLSKQLLYTFCNKTGRDSVCATYLLGGRLRSSGEDCIKVVRQEKYDEFKSLFESLTSEHVYSVQKAKCSPSSSTLYTVDSQPIEEKVDSSKSLGAIRCAESVCRAAEDLTRLRISLAPAPSTSIASKPAPPKPSTSKAPEKVSPVKSNEENGKGEHTEKDGKAKGGLAAMFAAQTAKASTKTTNTSSSKVDNNKNKKGGISNFFSKVSKEEQASNSKEVKSDVSPPKHTSKEEVKKISKDAGTSSSSNQNKKNKKETSNANSMNQEDKKSETEVKQKTTSKDSKQSSKKRGRGKEKKPEVKKRKRIVQLESSDEDDIFAEEGSASSREPSPVRESPVLEATPLESDEDDPAPEPEPEPVLNSGNGRCRRRRKVTKDKTFMDDDGYVVTEKVTEYESYSESDTDTTDSKKMKEPAKNPNIQESTSKSDKTKGKPDGKSKKASPSKKKSPVKNLKSPVKNKQQSLMNFFKKKE